jgi:hypothetical protein
VTELTVRLQPAAWLTANRQIPNHGWRRRIIHAIHEAAIWAATTQKLPPIDTKVVAEWTIRYPKGVGTVADPCNAQPTTKAILDALVGRWLPRDDSTFVVEERFRRGENLDEKGAHEVILRLIPVPDGERDITTVGAYSGGAIDEGPRVLSGAPRDTPSKRGITMKATPAPQPPGTPKRGDR